jgi:hypothetical protein
MNTQQRWLRDVREATLTHETVFPEGSKHIFRRDRSREIIRWYIQVNRIPVKVAEFTKQDSVGVPSTANAETYFADRHKRRARVDWSLLETLVELSRISPLT